MDYENEGLLDALELLLGPINKPAKIKMELDLPLRIRLERKVKQKLSQKGKTHAKG